MKTVVQVEPDYEEALRGAGWADFDAMMQAAAAAPVGWHRHRETVPLKINVGGRPETFYLKRVFSVPPKHAFWPLLRGRLGRSQPYREWHVLGALSRLGVPAMQRVAFGERRRFGMPVQAFLLVRAVPMAHTLRDWLAPGFPKPPGPLSAEAVDRLMHDLGRVIGRLHGLGFAWPDLHPKHIFAEPAENAGWRFCLIDVERMVCRTARCDVDASVPSAKSDAKSWRIEELRRFQRGLLPWRPTPESLSRFLDGYRKAAADCRGGPSERRFENDPAARRSERCPIRFAGLVPHDAQSSVPRLPDDYEHPAAIPFEQRGDVRIDARLAPQLEAMGLRRLEDVFAFKGGELKSKPGLSSHRERIRFEIVGPGDARRAYYLKRYDRPPLGEQLRRCIESKSKRSTAWRELHFIKRLGEIGIGTARPVAFGEKMTGRWENRSFLTAEEISGLSLEQWAAARSATHGRPDPPKPSWRERRDILVQLAAVARELHDARLFHRDLYLCHVFLTHNRGGEIVLRLIDLARMIERPWRPHRWRIKDLAALNYSVPSPLVTRADRLRFLYYYLGKASAPAFNRPSGQVAAHEQRLCKRRLKQLIVQVEARTRRMALHDARRSALQPQLRTDDAV